MIMEGLRMLLICVAFWGLYIQLYESLKLISEHEEGEGLFFYIFDDMMIIYNCFVDYLSYNSLISLLILNLYTPPPR